MAEPKKTESAALRFVDCCAAFLCFVGARGARWVRSALRTAAARCLGTLGRRGRFIRVARTAGGGVGRLVLRLLAALRAGAAGRGAGAACCSASRLRLLLADGRRLAALRR